MELHGHEDFEKIKYLRDRLQDKLFIAIPSIGLNGCPKNRHPGNLNVSITGISGEKLKEAIPYVIFSTSSACASDSPLQSHVLQTLNLNPEELHGSFRFGIGKYNSKEEIDHVAEMIIKLFNSQRSKPFNSVVQYQESDSRS